MLGSVRSVEVDDPRLFGVGRAIEAYFAGNRPDFASIPIDVELGTPFARLVWDTTRRIPYGERRPYGWVAREMGAPAATRAVGAALARNPVPLLVPCHRVVASNGSLRGFAGGIELKAALLNLEQRSLAA
jgi:methylated-DNA-[protein]-cysteine S-methyltransferase